MKRYKGKFLVFLLASVMTLELANADVYAANDMLSTETVALEESIEADVIETEETMQEEEIALEVDAVEESTEIVDKTPLASVGSLKAKALGSKKVQLTWEGVEGAEGYVIRRRIGDGEFEIIDSVDETTYIDETASDEAYNFYRVYAFTVVDGEKELGLSDTYVYAKCGLPAVKNLKAASVRKNQVSLTWTKVADAEGYMIYRKIGNGSFEYVDSTLAASYNDVSASETEYNFYRVYPYYVSNGNPIRGLSDAYVYAKGMKPLKSVQNLSATSQTKGTVRLKWKGVADADGYVIYRQVGDGGFAYLDKVTGQEYVDTKASEIAYNFYRVYPYYMSEGVMVKGPSDKYVYAKANYPLKAVTKLKAQTADIGCIKLSWQPVEEAEGYVIYRKVGNTTFEYLDETTDLNYLDVASDKTAYNFYRVYPYYMSEGVMVKGPSNTYVYAKGSFPKGWHYFKDSMENRPAGWYYINENGDKLLGEYEIDGVIYCFDEVTGLLQQSDGWLKEDGAWVYYKEDVEVYRFKDLKSVFDWASTAITYKVTDLPPAGESYLEWYADYGFENRYGNCYVMAATFCKVARLMGYEAYLVDGSVPLAVGGVGPHGWVEIVQNGTVYVCDPNFTNSTKRNGYFITYGTSGTWRYMNFERVE